VFIDCGSHDGCSIRKFRDTIDKECQYELYSFEANPNLKKYYENLENKQTHYNKAVWIYDGQIDFHVLGRTGAGTLSEVKNDHNLKKNLYYKTMWEHCPNEKYHPILTLNKLPIAKLHSQLNPEKKQVECVDLAGWVKNNFKKDDYIILKMDVEGAEYEILEKFFDDGIIKYVNEIFIELHNTRCGKTEADDSLLLNKLNEEGIKCDITWDAMHKPYLKEKECEESVEK